MPPAVAGAISLGASIGGKLAGAKAARKANRNAQQRLDEADREIAQMSERVLGYGQTARGVTDRTLVRMESLLGGDPYTGKIDNLRDRMHAEEDPQRRAELLNELEELQRERDARPDANPVFDRQYRQAVSQVNAELAAKGLIGSTADFNVTTDVVLAAQAQRIKDLALLTQLGTERAKNPEYLGARLTESRAGIGTQSAQAHIARGDITGALASGLSTSLASGLGTLSDAYMDSAKGLAGSKPLQVASARAQGLTTIGRVSAATRGGGNFRAGGGSPFT